MNALKKFTRSKIFVLLLLLILVTVFFSVMTNGTFIGLVNIRNIFNSMVVTAFLTVGAVPLMISGHIDLSAGNVGSMSGMLMALLLTNCGLPWPIAVLLALAAAAVFGLLNGALVNRFGFQSLIATLAVASVAEGATYLICNSAAIPIKDEAILAIGSGKIANVMPITIILAITAMLVYGIILAKTNYGKSIYIIGSNPHAARLTGLNPKRLHYGLFMNSAILGGVAGCLLAARLKSGTLVGIGDAQFAGLTGAILGGVSFGGGAGGMLGAFMGLLILNGFNNGLKVLKLSTYWQTVASGALLLIALLFDYLNHRRRVGGIGQSRSRT